MHDWFFLGWLTGFLGLWATCLHYFAPSVGPANTKFSRNPATSPDTQEE